MTKPSSSKESYIETNAKRLVEESQGLFDLDDIRLILESIGGDTPNLFNLEIAITNLHRILKLEKGTYFKKTYVALKKVQKIIENKDDILSKYSGHQYSNTCLLDRNKFDQNPRYGIFASTPLATSQKLTLVIDEKNTTYHPILTLAFLTALILIKNRSQDGSVDGLKTLCENIHYLINDQDSKDEITKLIQKYISHEKDPVNEISVFNLLDYLHNIKNSFRKETDLKKQAIELINKVANQRSKLQELLKLDYREPLFNDVDNNIPNQSNKEALPVIQVLKPEKPISTQILNKPDADERDLGVLPELKSNPFLRTLGIHGSEHEAQGLAHVNDTLLPNEIQLIEEAIFEDSHGDLDLEKIKLAWALMLYYSIPINAINFILIGQSEEDYSRDEYLWHIVIDLKSNLVMLPTPIQKLNQSKDDLTQHKHFSLPLEKKIKGLLLKIAECKEVFRLNSIITSDVQKTARSFKSLKNFRQYRITAGKVSRVLFNNVFWTCQDQVKTAYLQGGAYDFVHMGCYYTQLNTSELVELYKKVTSSIFRLHELLKTPLQNQMIGSLKTPSSETVRDFLNLKHSKLDELRKNVKTNEQLWEYHNQLALYTVTLLCIESSHRPHNDPFYSINNFIDHNLIQITEKEIMRGFEGRLALVEDTVANQVQIYLKHLENWSRALSLQGVNQTSKFLNDLVTGEMTVPVGIPLFFLIKNGSLSSISEKALNAYFNSENEINLECNFFRHFFSSELCRLNVPRIDIADQMGHNSKGLELGAKSRFNPNLTDKLILLPFLENIASSLDLKPTAQIPFAKYQSLNLKKIKASKKLLGPFKRSENRKIQLNTADVFKIDALLESKNFDPRAKKQFITIKLQSYHQLTLKNNGFSKPSKALQSYYLSKKTELAWIIEKSSTLAKSPFGRRYGIDFHNGKKLLSTINNLVLQVLDNPNTFNNEEKRVLLCLTAMASGSIFFNEHIIGIANLNLNKIEDIKLSSGTELIDSDYHKFWFLNSSTTALINLINEPVLFPITIDELEKTLTRFKLPKLNYLKRSISAYFALYHSNTLTHFIENRDSQSSIGLKDTIKILGDFSEINEHPNLFPNQNHLHPLEAEDKAANTIETSEFTKSINTILRNAKDTKLGHSRTLDALEEKWPFKTTLPQLNSAQTLLFEWIKLAITEKWHAVSSISQYFQNTYKFIERYFSQISLLDLDDEFLIDDLYPCVLKDMESYYEQKDSEVPTAALSSFHRSLETLRDIESVKFIGGSKINLATLQNQLLTEDEYQQCLSIVQKSNLDETSKKHLSLSLMLYRRLGLRKSEIFKLKIKDVCLQSKTIHVHGIKYDRQKTIRGNRLLPYSSLLKVDETKQFEEYINNQSLEKNSEKNLLLFHNQVEIYSKTVVVKKVTAYIQTLLLSVTGNRKVTIKSLRKTFASEVFVNLTMHDGLEDILKNLHLNRLDLDKEINRTFNQSQPHNLFWLLAAWMGHSSPLTTFKHYILTQELIIFLWSEKHLQSQPDYLRILKSINSKLCLKESAYWNLNRTPHHKYATFFQKHITAFTPKQLKERYFEIGELFPQKIKTDLLDKILTLYRYGYNLDGIDSKLLLSPLTSLAVIKKAKSLLGIDSLKNNTLFFDYLSKISMFKIQDSVLSANRTSEVYKKTMLEMSKLNHEDRIKLQTLWHKQFTETFVEPHRFQISSEDDLVVLLNIYKKIECHNEFGGYLLIEVFGYRNNTNDTYQLNNQEKAINISDKRKVSENRPSFVEKFNLYLSMRNHDAKKSSNSSLGLNAMIFWTLIKH